MTRIEKILSEYNDYELASMYHYLYPSYLSDTKDIIDKYLISRGITIEKIDIIIKEIETQKLDKVETSNLYCPRCLSKRIMIKEEVYNKSFRDTPNPRLKARVITCYVCGFIENDLDNIYTKFTTKLLNYLKKIVKKLKSPVKNMAGGQG